MVTWSWWKSLHKLVISFFCAYKSCLNYWLLFCLSSLLIVVCRFWLLMKASNHRRKELLASHCLLWKTRVSVKASIILIQRELCFLLGSCPVCQPSTFVIMRWMQDWCCRRLLCRLACLMLVLIQVGTRLPLHRQISSTTPAPVPAH